MQPPWKLGKGVVSIRAGCLQKLILVSYRPLIKYNLLGYESMQHAEGTMYAVLLILQYAVVLS